MWGFPVFANTGSGKPRACEGAGGSNELLRVSDRSKGEGFGEGEGFPLRGGPLPYFAFLTSLDRRFLMCLLRFSLKS